MAFIPFVVFLFGLVVGSFLNVVIYRLALAEGLASEVRDRGFRVPVSSSPFRGRSYCPHCKHQLAWRDLIPIASFALLGGKCRYCKKRISLQYPLVELATGTLFLFVFWHLGLGLDLAFGIWHLAFFELVYLWIIAALLIVLFVYDLKHYILPDKILFPAIGIVVAYRVFEIWNFGNGDLFGIWSLGFGALGATSFFLAIFLVSHGKAMGFGDVKLALFMGLFLGWPHILVALFFAFSAGAVVGVALILLGKKKLKSEVPFGPFLIAGTFFALFFGDGVVDWYSHLILV